MKAETHWKDENWISHGTTQRRRPFFFFFFALLQATAPVHNVGYRRWICERAKKKWRSTKRLFVVKLGRFYHFSSSHLCLLFQNNVINHLVPRLYMCIISFRFYFLCLHIHIRVYIVYPIIYEIYIILLDWIAYSRTFSYYNLLMLLWFFNHALVDMNNVANVSLFMLHMWTWACRIFWLAINFFWIFFFAYWFGYTDYMAKYLNWAFSVGSRFAFIS